MEIEKIKNLLEQLKEETLSLKDEKLQSSILSHINEIENLLPNLPKEEQEIINEMEKRKKQDYMTRFMSD